MRSPPIVPDEERPADELGATIIRGQYEDSVPQRGIACGTERALTTGRIRAAAGRRLWRRGVAGRDAVPGAVGGALRAPRWATRAAAMRPVL